MSFDLLCACSGSSVLTHSVGARVRILHLTVNGRQGRMRIRQKNHTQIINTPDRGQQLVSPPHAREFNEEARRERTVDGGKRKKKLNTAVWYWGKKVAAYISLTTRARLHCFVRVTNTDIYSLYTYLHMHTSRNNSSTIHRQW